MTVLSSSRKWKLMFTQKPIQNGYSSFPQSTLETGNNPDVFSQAKGKSEGNWKCYWNAWMMIQQPYGWYERPEWSGEKMLPATTLLQEKLSPGQALTLFNPKKIERWGGCRKVWSRRGQSMGSEERRLSATSRCKVGHGADAGAEASHAEGLAETADKGSPNRQQTVNRQNRLIAKRHHPESSQLERTQSCSWALNLKSSLISHFEETLRTALNLLCVCAKLEQ